jgi:hypothetical protein
MPAKHWKLFSKSSSGWQPNTGKSIIFREKVFNLKHSTSKKYFKLKQKEHDLMKIARVWCLPTLTMMQECNPYHYLAKGKSSETRSSI